MEEGLSGLKSFSEAGLDTDFINGDDYGIIEHFADYDLLQLREDIDNIHRVLANILLHC